jgi:hypothetical protein
MRKLGWLGVALAAVGCGSQDADCLGKLGLRFGDGTRLLVQQCQDRLRQDMPALRMEESVASRVGERLKHDKGLADATIEVRMVDGAIELHGQAHSNEQRRRAIDLAEATVGVEHVRDLIEVRPPDFGPAMSEPGS